MLTIARLAGLVAIGLMIFTRIDNFAGSAGDRFLVCDMAFIVAGLLYGIHKASRRELTLYFPQPVWRGSCVLLVAMIPGLLVSANAASTMVELLAHFFLVGVFLLLVNMYRGAAWSSRLAHTYVGSGALAAVLGLAQVLYGQKVSLLGFEVGGDVSGAAVGSFRNTGQAGAYCYTVLIFSCAWALAIWPTSASKPEKIFYVACTALMGIYIVATIKIMAIVGLVVTASSLLARSAFQDRSRAVLVALIAFSCAGVAAAYTIAVNPAVLRYMSFKVTSRIDSIEGGNSFFHANYSAALREWDENPILGSGVGGFAGVYHSHEVHSTYLKMLCECGVVGFLAYAAFCLAIVVSLRSSSRRGGVGGRFSDYLTSALVGGVVSWAYTYHLRKREFWVLLALAAVVGARSSSAGNKVNHEQAI